jgi:hypothetical protein
VYLEDDFDGYLEGCLGLEGPVGSAGWGCCGEDLDGLASEAGVFGVGVRL